MVDDSKEFNTGGALTSETIITTSGDGNTINTQNLDGNGNIVSTSTDVTTTDSTGATTEYYKEYDSNGTLTGETTTTTNPDGSSTTLDIKFYK